MEVQWAVIAGYPLANHRDYAVTAQIDNLVFPVIWLSRCFDLKYRNGDAVTMIRRKGERRRDVVGVYVSCEHRQSRAAQRGSDRKNPESAVRAKFKATHEA